MHMVLKFVFEECCILQCKNVIGFNFKRIVQVRNIVFLFDFSVRLNLIFPKINKL